MSVLFAILASEHDRDKLRRHWPYFKLPGWDILGCGTVDGKTVWPEKVPELNTGQIGTRQTQAGSAIFGLCQQELDIWKYCWDHPEYDSVCVVEADNLFIRKPPPHPGDKYLVTELPNRSPRGLFKTPIYFSTPRWADRETAAWLYLCGYAMLHRGETEHWMSDRFPALACYKHGIPWQHTGNWSPSTDCASHEDWVREMRAAVQAGAWCLHSVKTEQQLEEVKKVMR